MVSRIGLPMSLAYLAGTLRERFNVKVLELQFFPYEATPEDKDKSGWRLELEQAVLAEQPRLVGITCLFSGDIDKVLSIAFAVKTLSPAAKVVIGGVHPTIFSHEILTNCASVDFVIKGEGDSTVVELTAAVVTMADDFSHIDGLAWRNASGEIIEQKKTSYIENLDLLPRPAYDLFQIDKYPNPGSLPNAKNQHFKTNFPLLTSRSCGRVCNFCSLHNAMGKKSRMHSAARVLDDLEYVYNTYGMTYFDIEDDNFTLSKQRTLEICAGIRKRGLDIQFRLRNGVHIPTIDYEVADALAESGLAAVYLAIESGSEFIRNNVIGKNVPTGKIFAAVAAFARHPQVTTGAFIIIGMPEETRQTANDTLELLEKLDLDTFFFMPATPYPGTRLYDQCLRDGLFTEAYGDPATLWRRPLRIEQTIYDKNPLMIQPYDMTMEELLQYSRSLEILQSKVKYRSLLRKNRDAVSRLPGRINELLRRPNGTAKDLYLFGAGSLGRLVASHFMGGIEIRGFLDNNRALWGRKVENLDVFPPNSLTATGDDAVVLICVLNQVDAAQVQEQLTKFKIQNTLSLADELYGIREI